MGFPKHSIPITPEADFISLEVTPQEMQTGLNSIVLDTLPLASFWLGIYYCLIAISHLLFLPPAYALQMTAAASLSAALLFGLQQLLKRFIPSADWAHPLACLLAAIVLFNCSLHAFLTSDPNQTTNFALLVMGAGSLFLSMFWLGLSLVVIGSVWFCLIALLGFPEVWSHFAFMMLGATIITLIVHSVRMRVYQKDINMANRIRESQWILNKRTHELRYKSVALEKESRVRHQAEEKLVTLSLVASQTNNSVVITDKDGRIEWVNEGFTALCGYTPEEVIGKKPGTVLQGPDTHRETVRSIREKLKEKESFSVEILNYHKDGHSYWISLNITPILNNRGEISRFIAIQTDITEKKKVDETLQRQALVFENIYDAVIILDLSSRILDWNPAAERMFGYTKTEAMRITFADILPNNQFSRLREEVLTGLSTQKRWTQEMCFTRQDRTEAICETTLLPLCDPSQKPNALLGVFHDITKRNQVENALRQSEELFRSAFDNAAIGIALLGLDGRFLQTNQSLCGILGYDEEELLQIDFQSITHPDDLEVGMHNFRQILANKIVAFQLEKRYIHKGGYTIWALLSCSMVRSPEGEPLYLVSQIQDITERKHYEQALKESEERLQDFLDNANDLIQITDPFGKFVYVNRSWLETLGYQEMEVSHLYFWDVVADEHLQACMDLFHRVILGESIRDIELVFKSKNGKRITVAGGLNCRFEESVPVVMRSILRDITEQKQVAEDLQNAKEAAEAANLAKSQFLANMSHELRTPLNSVIGFANILMKNKKQNLIDSDLSYLKRIQGNGLHLLELINDILDLSKIEAGRVELEFLTVNVPEMIQELLNQFESQVRSKNIALTASLPPDLVAMQTDYGKLKQILINLVGNAVKFTDKGEVRIQAHSNPKTGWLVRIDVIDSGIGIAPDRLALIFESFQQADTSTSRKYGGTGLGLTISRSLCQMLGYSLEVHSEEGKGSTFSILIPDNQPSKETIRS